MKNKRYLDFINLLEKNGYKLESEYKNTITKVDIKCPKGHIYNATPKAFKSGNRCPKCSGKCTEQAKQLFIKILNEEGYKLESEYKNTTTKVDIRCSKGHIYNVKPNTFIYVGSRCPKCSGMCSEQAKEQFIELLYKEGYKLISEYNGTMSYVLLKCPKDHIYKTRPNDFKNRHRCSKCAGLCNEQAKEQFIKLLEREGYNLLSDYKSSLKHVILECPEGHKWKTKPNSFKMGYRCPHCAGSTGQRLLQSMLEENTNHKMVYNDRTILNGLELDIYFPELNIAIEYQGDYWHSRPETIERDKRKKELCKELGIRLMTIWDSEFMNDKQKTKERCMEFLNE